MDRRESMELKQTREQAERKRSHIGQSQTPARQHGLCASWSPSSNAEFVRDELKQEIIRQRQLSRRSNRELSNQKAQWRFIGLDWVKGVTHDRRNQALLHVK